MEFIYKLIELASGSRKPAEHAIYAPRQRLDIVFQTLINNIFFAFILPILLIYFLLCVPLSFAAPGTVRVVWTALTWIFGILGIISGALLILMAYVSYRQSEAGREARKTGGDERKKQTRPDQKARKQKPKPPLDEKEAARQEELRSFQYSLINYMSWLGALSFIFIFDVIVILSFLGLFPLSAFLEPIVLFVGFATVNAGVYLLVVLQNRSYLLRVLNLILVYSFYTLYLLSLRILTSIQFFLQARANPPAGWEEYVLNGYEIFSAVVLAVLVGQISTRVYLTSKKIIYLRTIIAVIMVVANVIFRLSTGIPVDFALLGMVTIIFVLEYYSMNTTRTKSSTVLIAGVGLYALLSTFSLYGSMIFEKYPIVQAYQSLVNLLAALGITVPAILIALANYLKKFLKEAAEGARGQKKVTEREILAAFNELREDNDYQSFDSAAKFVDLAIMSEGYELAYRELDNWKKDPSLDPDLVAYFQIFLYCANFEHCVNVGDRGEARVMKIPRLAHKGEKMPAARLDSRRIPAGARSLRGKRTARTWGWAAAWCEFGVKKGNLYFQEKHGLRERVTALRQNLERGWVPEVIKNKEQFDTLMRVVLKGRRPFSARAWTHIVNNAIIKKNLNPEILKPLQPYTTSRLKEFATKSVFYVVIAAMMLSMAPGLTPAVFGEMIQPVRNWGLLRMSEFRLNMVEAFQPYAGCLNGCAEDYAYGIANWADEWLSLRSTTVGGVRMVKPEDAGKAQHWFEMVPAFYTTQDLPYYKSLYHIGEMHRLQSDCEKASTYYDQVIKNPASQRYSDLAAYYKAECFIDAQSEDKALAALEPIQNETGHPQSKALLAELLLRAGRPAETLALLEDEEILAQWGDVTTLLREGAQVASGSGGASLPELEALLARFAESGDDARLVQTYVWLGEGYYQKGDPFASAEHFYRAISLSLMRREWLSTRYLEDLHPHFGEAIEMVKVENPKDHRIYLWKFTHDILIPDAQEEARSYLNLHRSLGTGYGADFVEWLDSRQETTPN